jgi:hypothetical protein
MDRLLLAAALLAALAPLACGPSFKEMRTPSGGFCHDMPIVPADQDPERAFRRLQPIQSDAGAGTEDERIDSLRRAACKLGADAVIEAANEEVRAEGGQLATVSSGTAVVWTRRPGGDVQPGLLPPTTKAAGPEPSAEPAPTAGPNAAPGTPPAKSP